MIKYVLYTVLLSLAFTANAQLASLSGSIKDQNGSPIPGAGIYISGYKAATVSDDNGIFKFPALTAGNYNILIQAIGFLPEKVNIEIQKENVSLAVRLKESTT
ncbi:MAG: carboxypeptidase-like regulatory domain-containing protein, partial [Pedobacter sp.]